VARALDVAADPAGDRDVPEWLGLGSNSALLVLALTLLASGAALGLLSGLFGVGGGTVAVPVLYETFRLLAVADDVLMPLCIGTSLAIIIPTSISSFLAHRRHGNVDWSVLRVWIAPILCGVVLGTIVAHFAHPTVFKLAFICVALATALRMLFAERLGHFGADLPSGMRMAGYGLSVGASSSLVGIGGGLVANMLMTLHGRPLRQAIATSSAIGVIVSLPGAIGYMIAGWHAAGLPPFSLGFVSLIGLSLLVPTSLLMARVGVSVAHRLSKERLQNAFAVYLLFVSARFLLSMFQSAT
jgi:uncharacterized membrane protein YfcA